MNKWEYIVHVWQRHHFGFAHELAFQANDLGDGGYELVSVVPGPSEGELMLFFKRPKADE
jgi:hypothetical protein